MIDLRRTIAPKSDQLNADDLIGASRIIQITGVELCSEADQPVAIHFDGDNGKPFKPCKSMRRVLVNLWGPDAKAYTGRKIKIYRDDKVLFGGVAVGGVRISHVSDIDKPVTMALTVTRANRKPYTVQPLQSEPESPHAADDEKAAKAAALNGTVALREFWGCLDAPRQRALQPSMQNFKEIAAKKDFASEPDSRAPLGGGKRAMAYPESLAGTPASGAAGGAAPTQPLKSPDAPSFDREEGDGPSEDPMQAAYERGRTDRRAGKSVRAVPGEYRTQERQAEADEWRTGWGDEDQERKAA